MSSARQRRRRQAGRTQWRRRSASLHRARHAARRGACDALRAAAAGGSRRPQRADPRRTDRRLRKSRCPTSCGSRSAASCSNARGRTERESLGYNRRASSSDPARAAHVPPLSLTASQQWNSPRASNPRTSSGAGIPLWESRGYFEAQRRSAAARLLHPAAAAQRHRHAAHGTRVPADADGRARSATTACAASTRTGWSAPTMPASPRRSWSSASSRPKARAGTTSAARSSSSASGSGSSSPARPSPGRCAAWARPPTGATPIPKATGRGYFTMDARMSQAVIEVFVRLHEQGLIYRGKRLVNWDPVLGTAVSDLEVDSEEEDGKIWEIRYPFADGDGRRWWWRRRARRRCWATSRWRCIRRTSAIGRSSAGNVQLPLTGRHDSGHRRRLRRSANSAPAA